ncbi:hypothetical protein KFK09_029238 [Dendrobium nobile]|uniref:Uncharacterized protein n=1 Tax=Dendrobium nobile TaxID=94219 RepID=A0A8T3A4Y9_DENNO|nr:hypothetical protein KFK09_029238 [Dendrobium nobile]
MQNATFKGATSLVGKVLEIFAKAWVQIQPISNFYPGTHHSQKKKMLSRIKLPSFNKMCFHMGLYLNRKKQAVDLTLLCNRPSLTIILLQLIWHHLKDVQPHQYINEDVTNSKKGILKILNF